MTIEPATTGSLAARTMASLRAFFDARDHRPSHAHWQALEDIAATMEAMANGTCPAEVRLSSVDPGCGKSMTVVRFARALATSDEHHHVGMIVCVGRIAEAEALATELSDIRDRLAVLVQEGHAANSLGGAAPEDAQVLITTQQRIERATDGRQFEHVSRLFYRGGPRRVRIWDEAFLPGVAIALRGDDLGFLLKPARRISAQFNADLLTLIARLNAARTGDLLEVPDLEQAHGATVHDMFAAISGGDGRMRDDQHAVARALFMLSGRVARVWRDNKDGSAVLSWEDTLPEDLKPLLVLDASGRVRRTYADMELHRGLVRLRYATKDYSPLAVHVWRRGGGKTSLRESGAEITKGIAETILTKPREAWLVVAHKSGNGIRDMERELRKLLPDDVRPNVTTITWGQHMASNLYQDTPNVILAGTLFMRESHYVALTHLVQGRPTAPGFATDEDVAETRLGEHANHVLQALCRGRVRKLDGDRCFPMSAYVIASTRSGVPEHLATIFPGATITEWEPVRRGLTGKPKAAFEAVQKAIASGSTWIPFTAIASSIGMDAANFRKHVAKRSDWLDAMADLGLSPSTGARGAKVLRLVGHGVERKVA